MLTKIQCYNLHQLLQEKELLAFFHSLHFDEMLLKVANDDVVSFKNNNAWLKYHPINAKIFVEVETVWNILKTTYNKDFKNLVFGNFPNDNEILKTLLTIKNLLTTIEWKINIDNK